MTKNEKKALLPVSLEVYRQLVHECATMLMGSGCDNEQVMNRLIDLANCPILSTGDAAGKEAETAVPKVKVIIDCGVASEVLADSLVDLEVINIDKDYEDCDQLRTYEAKLHEDKSLKQIDFTSANFEED